MLKIEKSRKGASKSFTKYGGTLVYIHRWLLRYKIEYCQNQTPQWKTTNGNDYIIILNSQYLESNFISFVQPQKFFFQQNWKEGGERGIIICKKW